MKDLLRRIVRHLPGYRRLDRYLCYRYTGNYVHELYPRGHHYSLLPNISEVQSRAGTLFSGNVDLAPSIDFKPEKQYLLVTELARYYSDFQWPDQPSQGFRFHFRQPHFAHGDAVILHAMLRHFKPKRIIEIGAGFTSALMLDTDERFFGGQIHFTFIEPFPARFLSLVRKSDIEKCNLLQAKVQDTPLTLFRELDVNDILFVDSSHVSKIGSDVNFILFEVLPKLRPGVLIHFHDIFWPFEYPLEWITLGIAWNEAYLVRAFLQYNSHFEIILLNHFVGRAFRQFFEAKMPVFLKDPGGSLWIRKMT